MPDPHLSQVGNLSAFPTDDPIFVDGAFTLLKPDGLSQSPRKTSDTNNLHILLLVATGLIRNKTNKKQKSYVIKLLVEDNCMLKSYAVEKRTP